MRAIQPQIVRAKKRKVKGRQRARQSKGEAAYQYLKTVGNKPLHLANRQSRATRGGRIINHRAVILLLQHRDRVGGRVRRNAWPRDAGNARRHSRARADLTIIMGPCLHYRQERQGHHSGTHIPGTTVLEHQEAMQKDDKRGSPVKAGMQTSYAIASRR